jgi:hypothetical protein
MKRPRIKFTTSVQVDQYLGQLKQTGLFGRTKAEIAERLVCDRLIELSQEGWIKIRLIELSPKDRS